MKITGILFQVDYNTVQWFVLDEAHNVINWGCSSSNSYAIADMGFEEHPMESHYNWSKAEYEKLYPNGYVLNYLGYKHSFPMPEV